jgi:hypothetical protein
MLETTNDPFDISNYGFESGDDKNSNSTKKTKNENEEEKIEDYEQSKEASFDLKNLNEQKCKNLSFNWYF